MKILTAETNLTSATNISKSPVIRVYNSDSSAITLTRKSNAGTTIGSYSVPSGKVIYCEKSYTDTLEGGAALKATGVGYSEELDIICLGNGGGSSIVDTDLYVHYDFSSTDCWNRTNGTNTDDYTVHNLANDYNDGLFRSLSNTTYLSGYTVFDNDSSSSIINFDSSDGGGCLHIDGTQYSSTEDTCAFILPGSQVSNTINNMFYQGTMSAVSSTDSNNLYNGIGTGAFTVEYWLKYYVDFSETGSNYGQFWGITTNNKGTLFQRLRLYDGGASSLAGQIRLRSWVSGQSPTYIDLTPSGAPSSPNSGWTGWNHIVMSRNSDATNDTKIYLNNNLENTHTFDGDLDYLRDAYFHYYNSYSDHRQEKLGIFRFYRGKALTASEVTENWNAQKSRFGY